MALRMCKASLKEYQGHLQLCGEKSGMVGDRIEEYESKQRLVH